MMDKLYMVRRYGQGAEIWTQNPDELVATVHPGEHELSLATLIVEAPAMLRQLRLVAGVMNMDTDSNGDIVQALFEDCKGIAGILARIDRDAVASAVPEGDAVPFCAECGAGPCKLTCNAASARISAGDKDRENPVERPTTAPQARTKVSRHFQDAEYWQSKAPPFPFEPAKQTCETCRFRKPADRPELAGAGQCRRYPPIVVEQVAFDGLGSNHFGQHWPWMEPTDWCGEWKAGA